MPHERIDPVTVDIAWRRERATRATLVVDAADYFAAAREAMLKATRRIMLVGWDFDARIELGERLPDEPRTLGDFILWLVERKPALEVFLLRWNIGAIRTLFRGPTMLTVVRWMAHPRIHTRLDAASPAGASHHHKIVAIDDSVAFCGGIDMTSNRWDTPEHKDDDPRRLSPNGTPYGAWHDTIMAVEGPAAAALGELTRERWQDAGGQPLEPAPGAVDCWPDSLPAQFRDVSVAISRSRPGNANGNGAPPIYEIESAFISAIERAEHFIYAESQYFASRRIAEAMAERLAEPHGPEIVLINPKAAHGWLEPIAMDTARARLVEFVHRADHGDRFRLYHPVTAGGQPIYVHAKVLIVDDGLLHAGSANMNNRSLRLDTECDLTIDAQIPGNGTATEPIAALREALMAEHLGVTPDVVRAAIAREGCLVGAVEALRRESGRTLLPLEMQPLNDVEKWLADNELLDPEGPEEMFKPLSQRGLLRRLGKRFHLPRPRRLRRHPSHQHPPADAPR